MPRNNIFPYPNNEGYFPQHYKVKLDNSLIKCCRTYMVKFVFSALKNNNQLLGTWSEPGNIMEVLINVST